MKLNDLIIFDRLFQRLNMSTVAKELYISQSSISYSISKLENELGVKLFVRTGKKLVPTSEGKVFADYATLFKTAYEDMQRNFCQQLPQDYIRVGIAYSSHEIYGNALLKEFTQRHPQCQLFSNVDNSKNLQSQLMENRLDVLLTTDILPSGADALEHTLLYESDLVFCCLPDAGYINLEIADLSRVTQADLIVRELPVLMMKPQGEVSRMEMYLPRTIAEDSPVCRAAGMFVSFTQAKEAAKLGLGAAIVPRRLVHEDDGLMCFTIAGMPFQDNLHLVYKREDEELPKIRNFVKLVKEFFNVSQEQK